MREIYVVGAVILNSRDEVLCALRSAEMSVGGVWEFPGGKIENGESAEEALVREIQEELNCTIEVGDFVANCVHTYDRGVIHLDTYFARVVQGTPTKTEHDELVRLPISKLDTLEWAPADVATVEALKKCVRLDFHS